MQVLRITDRRLNRVPKAIGLRGHAERSLGPEKNVATSWQIIICDRKYSQGPHFCVMGQPNGEAYFALRIRTLRTRRPSPATMCNGPVSALTSTGVWKSVPLSQRAALPLAAVTCK